MKRPNRVGVGSIELLPPVATQADQIHLSQHAEVLRDGWLRQAQSHNDFPNGALLQHQIAEYFAPPRFGDSIESIRGGRRACHGNTIHSYMGICQVTFFRRRKYVAPSVRTVWIQHGNCFEPRWIAAGLSWGEIQQHHIGALLRSFEHNFTAVRREEARETAPSDDGAISTPQQRPWTRVDSPVQGSWPNVRTRCDVATGSSRP
jgi:hypothetical protein